MPDNQHTDLPDAAGRPVAVTGASGFVGRRIVRQLLDRGVPVLALTRDPGKCRRLFEMNSAAELTFRSLDLMQADEVPDLGGAAAIIHAAAHIPSDTSDPAEAAVCLEANAVGTLRLVQAAEHHGLSGFVYLSAGNCYRDQGRSAREDDPLYPSGRAPYYLTSKLCGELFAANALERGSLEVSVLRPSAIYGAGMAAGLVTTVIQRLVSGQTVKANDGARYRADLVYVGDVVAAAIRCLETSSSGIFNIGSGRATSVTELVTCVASILNIESPEIEYEGDRSGPPLGYPPLDISRARATLDFTPTSINEGLTRMLAGMSQ